jgi:hypothetical protein
MSRYFFRELQEVQALEPYRLRTRWSSGETLKVDITDKLAGNPALATILDPKVFATAHVAEWGQRGMIRHRARRRQPLRLGQGTGRSDFPRAARARMRRNGLSLTTAAEALGLSRRMISDCRTAQRPIA